MNIQTVIVLLLFAAAVFYMVRMIAKTLSAKKGCGTSCKCGVDLSGIRPSQSGKPHTR
jgi:hypothetical protein